MRVMVIPVDATKDTYTIELSGDTLHAMQELVGGYIECATPAQLREQGIELIVNEEGLLAQLPPNEKLFPFFLVGQVIAVGVGEEDFISLTPEQIEYLNNWLFHLWSYDGYHGHP